MNTITVGTASRLGTITFAFALGAASNLHADAKFTSIDFPGSIGTQAWGITLSGDIVGFYMTPDKATHGFLRSRGQYISIDYPGAMFTEINGVSPRGDLIGDYAATVNGSGPHHGFVLDIDGNYKTIDYPDATTTFAIGMNSRGDILGTYTLADNVNHVFVMNGDPFSPGGQFKEFPDYPGASQTVVIGITGGDVVGGYATPATPGVNHGFLWSDGEFTSLDSVAGASFTNVTAISTRGEMVGRYTLNGVTHAYLRSGTEFTTYDAPGANFTGFTAISANGDIVGRWRDTNNVFHGLVLSGFRTACAAPAQ